LGNKEGTYENLTGFPSPGIWKTSHSAKEMALEKITRLTLISFF
jgi:hypothetical protein